MVRRVESMLSCRVCSPAYLNSNFSPRGLSRTVKPERCACVTQMKVPPSHLNPDRFGGITRTSQRDYIYIAPVRLLSVALDFRLLVHGQTPDPSLLRGGIRFLVLC